jgi:hypothetical protein
MHEFPRRRRVLTGLLLLSGLIAACGGAVATPSAPPAVPSSDAPVATIPPVGDGSAGDGLPPAGGAKVVVPRPGQLDVRPVAAESLAATVNGRSVVISADWWSGVEPCTILDSIAVERAAFTIAIALREGRGPDDVACIAIAELHRAFIDLGELEPGTYTIQDATGGAPPITVVVD